jgi:hypothetical protein
MLSIAHGLTGAVIVTGISNPYISLPLALISHYALDVVPHWDVGQGLSKKTKSKRLAFLQELFIDFPGSILLVFLFFPVTSPQPFDLPFNTLAFLGWFIALLPDFVEFPKNFLHLNPPIFKQLNYFHNLVHHSIPNTFVGLLPQTLLILYIYLIR